MAFALVLPAAAQAASWIQMPSLPQPVYAPSCTSIGDFLFCVGGSYTQNAVLPSLLYTSMGPVQNNTIVTPVIANGSTIDWSPVGEYPYNTSGQVCTLLVNSSTSNSSIVCVGGIEHVLPGMATGPATQNTTTATSTSTIPKNEIFVAAPTDGTFMTQAFPGGINGWVEIALYPMTPAMQSCTADGGHIYCVGGYNATRVGSSGQGNAIDSVYYATVVPGASIAWSATTKYPDNVSGASCVSHAGYVYCVGGHTSDVYYARVGPSGALGAWEATRPYPFSTYYQGCTVVNASLYCVGGVTPSGASVSAAYYSRFLASGGLSRWAQAGSYPLNISGEGCASVNSSIYCMGGLSEQKDRIIGSAYRLNTTYAPVQSNTTTTTLPQNMTVPTTTVMNGSGTTTIITGPPTITTTPPPGNSSSTASRTVPQTGPGGNLYITLIIIVVVLILAALAYAYLSRRKPKPNAAPIGR